MRADAVAAVLPYLTPGERSELDKLLSADKAIWRPQPGPQLDAYTSQADIIGYGGAAGGGKTDLACGKALTQHRRTMILRREATQLTGIIDRLTELIGSRDGYNGQDKIWRLGERQIEFGSVPHAGDETKYQGRPHDFINFDEAANFLESQVRFLLGWLRTTTPGQKCQALLTFNPPTNAEGRWLISYFAPWLDDKHPNPAKPGTLRWFATIDGQDVEVEDGEPFVLAADKQPLYDFNPLDYAPDAIIRPLSRTFIPSRVADNPYLTGTGYMATLQSLPEPLRSQMLRGDFLAGMEDDIWQVIPTAWVDASMDRWKPRNRKGVMDSLGVDVARGGRDKTVLSPRYDLWFDELKTIPGSETPNGQTVFAHVLSARRDLAPLHIDIVGWGASAYDQAMMNGIQTIGVNGAAKATGRTRDGKMMFVNLRAEIWWRVREALDPDGPEPIDLPPDQELRSDLCAPRWSLQGRGILVESKDDIYERIHRSPDKGDAVCLANMRTPRRGDYDDRDDRRGQSESTGY